MEDRIQIKIHDGIERYRYNLGIDRYNALKYTYLAPPTQETQETQPFLSQATPLIVSPIEHNHIIYIERKSIRENLN